MNTLFWLVIFFMVATAIVLVWGLVHMIRNKGVVDAQKSNQLMYWRVALQAAAIIAFVSFLYLAAK